MQKHNHRKLFSAFASGGDNFGIVGKGSARQRTPTIIASSS